MGNQSLQNEFHGSVHIFYESLPWKLLWPTQANLRFITFTQYSVTFIEIEVERRNAGSHLTLAASLRQEKYTERHVVDVSISASYFGGSKLKFLTRKLDIYFHSEIACLVRLR